MSEFTSKLIEVSNLNDATKGLITEENAPVFEALCSHMLKVNDSLNLTAIRDEDGVILKHFVDSCALVPFIPQGASMIDVGCGGGFPSLPVAILRPDVKVLGLDSVTKKVNYVADTAKLLGLSNVITSNARAEVLGQDSAYREKYDVVSARGVGRLCLLCELCLPLLKIGGKFIAMKSIGSDAEIDEALNAMFLLGGKIEKVISFPLTNGKEDLSRTIVVIKKVSPTPKKYPRNNSQIAKKPLLFL